MAAYYAKPTESQRAQAPQNIVRHQHTQASCYNAWITHQVGLCVLQISAIKVLLGDLKGGLNKVNTEILKAAGVDANSAFAHRQFGDLMMSFHQHAKQTFADLEVNCCCM